MGSHGIGRNIYVSITFRVKQSPKSVHCRNSLTTVANKVTYIYRMFLAITNTTVDELRAEIEHARSLPAPTILGEDGRMYHDEDEADEAKDTNDYLEYLWDN